MFHFQKALVSAEITSLIMVVLPEHFYSALELLWVSLANFSSDSYITKELIFALQQESFLEINSKKAYESLQAKYHLSKKNHPFSNTGIQRSNLSEIGNLSKSAG